MNGWECLDAGKYYAICLQILILKYQIMTESLIRYLMINNICHSVS